MPEPKSIGDQVLVIGFGNTQRRDDGIGPYLVQRLEKRIGPCAGVGFVAAYQLSPEMAEDLQRARAAIFVDATVEFVEHGWRCEQIGPEPWNTSFQTHHLAPGLLLGLLLALYGRVPPAWMVAIQGEDFGFGTQISSAARSRAERAVEKIMQILENIPEKEYTNEYPN